MSAVCIALFVGLDSPIVERPFVKGAPTPFVRLVRDPVELPAPYFTKPYVYEIGDEEGCACGFNVPGVGLWDANDERELPQLKKAVRSIDWIRELLEEASRTDKRFQLYVGEVDEYEAPTADREVVLKELEPPPFSADEYVKETKKQPGVMFHSPWDLENWKGPLWTVVSA
jgi:hypothetical protein